MSGAGPVCRLQTAPPTVTVVVPVLNEEHSLRQLVSELQAGVAPHAAGLQIVLVDDGSADGSWGIICELAQQHAALSGIRLRRNFGKAAALTAGMQVATGSLILMLDADLQDDPSEFHSMLQKMQSGYDVVNGWKQRRLDPWHKVYPSRVFNWLVGWMTGLRLHDHNCGLKLFRREVAEEIHIYGELHRFIPVLAHSRGFRVTEVAVHHRPRQFGVSKYGVRRFLRGLLDLLTVTFLTGFRRRPLHAIGGAGLLLLGIGTLGLAYLAIVWLLIRSGVLPTGSIGSRPLLAYSVAAVLLGGQILSLGLLAELIVAFTGRSEETYSVRERTDS